MRQPNRHMKRAMVEKAKLEQAVILVPDLKTGALFKTEPKLAGVNKLGQQIIEYETPEGFHVRTVISEWEKPWEKKDKKGDDSKPSEDKSDKKDDDPDSDDDDASDGGE
jgi:hypothetical protein